MEDGVAKMRQVEGGFPIPAGGEHVLQRGADHVMFMGLNDAMEQGDTVTVTLVFREAGEITVDIPVDLERQPQGGQMNQGQMDHSNMGHGNMNN
jgi:copper(I)-binding protein